MKPTWIEYGPHFRQEIVFANGFLELKVRPAWNYIAAPAGPLSADTCKWCYDCGPITTSFRYESREEAKRACIDHARRMLQQAMRELDAMEQQP